VEIRGSIIVFEETNDGACVYVNVYVNVYVYVYEYVYEGKGGKNCESGGFMLSKKDGGLYNT